MHPLLIIFFSTLVVLSASAGTIIGTVRAEGKEGAGDSSRGGKYNSRKFKFVEKIDYSQLTDFVVYIDQPVTNLPASAPKTVQVVTQRDAVFRPHVLPIFAGTTVEWPNKDDIFHNVFSISESNPFDLGLYKDPELKKVQFKNIGRVDVFCSIHSQMSCVILVLQNPFFATPDRSGHFRIPNVPAGTYKLKAWHQRVPPDLKEVVVQETGEIEVEFILSVKGLPQY